MITRVFDGINGKFRFFVILYLITLQKIFGMPSDPVSNCISCMEKTWSSRYDLFSDDAIRLTFSFF